MIRIGILGLGVIGHRHLEAFAQVPGALVVAVATAGSSPPPGTRRAADVAALVDADDVDAVVVALPTDLHADAVLHALRAGKPVLVEKPVTRDLAGAARILAEPGRAPAMVAHVLRHHAAYQEAARLVRSGALGTVLGAHTQRLAATPLWAGWLTDPVRSGGALTDLLVHDADLLTWLFGTPAHVRATGARGPAGGWDLVEATLLHDEPCALATAPVDPVTQTATGTMPTLGPPGPNVHLSGTYLMPPGYPFTASLRAVGTEGALELYQRERDATGLGSGSGPTLTVYRADGAVHRPALSAADPFVVQAQAFVDAVRTGVVPTGLDLADGVAALRVIAAIERALESGSKVSVTGVADRGS